MTNFVPVFPLSLVVYPGEHLNLHIFEPRYKQLINDCYSNNKPFGIPVVLNNQVAEMGTLTYVREIVQVYEDGKMDIRTEGSRVFRILELVNSIPDKLYSGAIVNYPENDEQRNSTMVMRVLKSLRELHQHLNAQKDFKKPDEALCSYDLAHHAGMSLEEEYELLGLMQEPQRLEYLKRHFAKVLPIVTSMESLKERIQLNGHFKELKGFNFEL